MKYIALTMAILALTVAGCTRDETLSAYGATGRIWTVTEVHGDGFDGAVTMTFGEHGEISGTAACNTFTASSKVPYPWFEAGDIARSSVGCTASEAEETFFLALSRMTLAEVLGDTLILSSPDGESIILTSGD